MNEPVAGKFLLEILTKGMYSNPLHIYREYIQNASDSIDKAISKGLICPGDAEVHISVDKAGQKVSIVDNGIGISSSIARVKLLSVGVSDKDGIVERGFRGIGRLGGLAYAKEVQFITSSAGDNVKTIMTCDCARMQILLQKSNNETSDIMETFQAISSFAEEPEESNKHYFEVHLIGVPEESGLLEETEVTRYLAETAPIDFDSQQFLQARKIREYFLEKGWQIPCYKILRGTRRKPIYKLYSRSMSTGQQERTKSKDYVRDVEFVYKETHDGTPLCIGWIAITDFSGSISDEAIQGIRFRKGNILVGDNSTFSKFFPLSSLEASRANKCFAGEIHILHKDIVPNSQRDDFEPSAAYNEMKLTLSEWAATINKKYRRGTSEATSALRSLNKLNEEQKELEQKIGSGAITSDEKRDQIAEQLSRIARKRDADEKRVQKALSQGTFDEDRKDAVEKALAQTEKSRQRIVSLNTKIINADYATKNDLPSSYSRDERKLYQRIISVIDAYFSDDPSTAESLRDRIKSELSVKKK